MACEACAMKFNLFKRKKQCMDCLRYFCTECVIRRFDRILSCDNCSMLSRRPLIKSQVLQMKSKYLRQYLLAKRVSLRGCIEKEDLVNLVIVFANGNNEPTRNFETSDIVPPTNDVNQTSQADNSDASDTLQSRRSRSPQENDRLVQESMTTEDPNVEISVPEEINENVNTVQHNVEIEELSEVVEENINVGPEPVISENEEIFDRVQTQSSDMFGGNHTWTGMVKLSDIKEVSEFEYLTVKQLKDLLSANRVDFKGCVERCELLDRASRLWEEYRKSRREVEFSNEEALCKICLDAPIECVILECGHIACCINCGKQMSECPICRQYVVRVVRFFKA